MSDSSERATPGSFDQRSFAMTAARSSSLFTTQDRLPPDRRCARPRPSLAEQTTYGPSRHRELLRDRARREALDVTKARDVGLALSERRLLIARPCEWGGV